MEGFLIQGWDLILSGCGVIVGFLRGETPAACASAPHCPRPGGKRGLGQWDWVRKTLG